jgi:two-component system LytT family response regulator
MTSVVLIDDEPLARTIVREYLQSNPDFEIIGECSDGFEGVKVITQKKPDLIFLDIQMPKINGFEMLELLETPLGVIFTTAFDEYAIDYLLKPFSKERFDKALSKWKGMTAKEKENTSELISSVSQPEERTRIVVKKGSNLVILPVHTVYYLEAYDDYIKVHTKEGFFLKKKTMTHYEKVLDPGQFVRVHRSFMINLQELTRIEPLTKDSHIALLKSGARIPLSEAGFAKLRGVLGI